MFYKSPVSFVWCGLFFWAGYIIPWTGRRGRFTLEYISSYPCSYNIKFYNALHLSEIIFAHLKCEPPTTHTAYLHVKACKHKFKKFTHQSHTEIGSTKLLELWGWTNNYAQCMFIIYYKCSDLTSTPFFCMVSLLFDTLCPSSHNLLYVRRIKGFGVTVMHACTVSFICWCCSFLMLSAWTTILNLLNHL